MVLRHSTIVVGKEYEIKEEIVTYELSIKEYISVVTEGFSDNPYLFSGVNTLHTSWFWRDFSSYG